MLVYQSVVDPPFFTAVSKNTIQTVVVWDFFHQQYQYKIWDLFSMAILMKCCGLSYHMMSCCPKKNVARSEPKNPKLIGTWTRFGENICILYINTYSISYYIYNIIRLIHIYIYPNRISILCLPPPMFPVSTVFFQRLKSSFLGLFSGLQRW